MSKQHYANELSLLGHTVYFVNPPNKWRISNLFSFKIELKSVKNNLTIVDLKNNFPQSFLPKLFIRLNDFLNYNKIKKKLNLGKETIWWKFDPFRFIQNHDKTIYHVVDPYMHFWQNKIHARNADLVICTSPKYLPLYNELNPKKIIKISHGVSSEEFNTNTELVNNIKLKYGDFVILVGSIADDINIELIKKIIKLNIKILIIGSEKTTNEKWNSLKTEKNIFYLGVIPATTLKNYISAAKVCLVSYNFKSNQKGQITRSPLKILNYLAQLKPIITSIDSDIEELEGYGIYKCNNETEYCNTLQLAIEDKLKFNKQKVTAYLENHKYDKLITQILKSLN